MGSAKVHISDRAIISALNTPGGAVFRWRDEIGQEIKRVAISLSPVNDELNAQHRGGVVGTYKKGWGWDRRGSRGHHVIARVTNSAAHAQYVEYGRSASRKMQIFSWTEWGGEIKRVGGPTPRLPRRGRKMTDKQRTTNRRLSKLPERVGSGTGARAGQYVLTRAVAAALGSAGISARG